MLKLANFNKLFDRLPWSGDFPTRDFSFSSQAASYSLLCEYQYKSHLIDTVGNLTRVYS